MRLLDGRWQCVLCGEVLETVPDRDPQVMIVAASGQPNIAALMMDGIEIHRCPFEPVKKADG